MFVIADKIMTGAVEEEEEEEEEEECHGWACALMRATFERCFEQSAILNFARGLIHRNALKNAQWNNHKKILHFGSLCS